MNHRTTAKKWRHLIQVVFFAVQNPDPRGAAQFVAAEDLKVGIPCLNIQPLMRCRLRSIDQDGARTGYDLELTRLVAEGVGVPVIASGGAGGPGHIREAFTEGKASAALLAGILHDGLTSVRAIKEDLCKQGVEVR